MYISSTFARLIVLEISDKKFIYKRINKNKLRKYTYII